MKHITPPPRYGFSQLSTFCVLNRKPPAMRVEDKSLYKISLPKLECSCSGYIVTKGRGKEWHRKPTAYLTQNGCVSTI